VAHLAFWGRGTGSGGQDEDASEQGGILSYFHGDAIWPECAGISILNLMIGFIGSFALVMPSSQYFGSQSEIVFFGVNSHV
jgi:hypothetical protein